MTFYSEARTNSEEKKKSDKLKVDRMVLNFRLYFQEVTGLVIDSTPENL